MNEPLLEVARQLNRAKSEAEMLDIVYRTLIIQKRFKEEYQRLRYIEALCGYKDDPAEFVSVCQRCGIGVRETTLLATQSTASRSVRLRF